MYEAPNGVIFSEVLEHFGYILNRVDEPVPVLKAPIGRYLPVSRLMFSDKTGDFIINTPTGENHFGAILNIKEYSEATYRSEEHTSELQSLMRNSYAVCCLKKKMTPP